MTNWRELCAELADRLDYVTQCLLDDNRLTDPLSDRARTALSQPEPKIVGPSDEDRQAIVARLRELAFAVTEGPEALAKEGTISIPPRPLRDADLVLSTAADMLDQEAAPQPSPVAALNIIFDGPPGPEAGRFIEVETEDGRSVCAGEWSQRPDGHWSLRITKAFQPAPVPEPEVSDRIRRALIAISSGLCYFTAEAKHVQLLAAQNILTGATDNALPVPGAEVG